MRFTVSAHISRPVEEVFESVVDPEKLSAFFTTGGANGRITSGAEVMWDFHDFPGAFPVTVINVEANKEIILDWEATDGMDDTGCGTGAGYNTRVIMKFSALDDGRTLVSISEDGWKDTEPAVKASYGNCEGWTQMLCAMKVWNEHGINLRENYYK